MNAIPQYMASEAPEVLWAVRENERRRKAFFVAIREWADEMGVDNAGFLSTHTGLFATDLPKKPEGRGEWTQRSGWWRPFKNNKAEWVRINRIHVQWEAIPGLPANVYSEESRDGGFMRMFPQPFEHDGRAWIGYPHPPAMGRRNEPLEGGQWVEVLASEFMAAKKSHAEAAKEEGAS